MIQRKQTIWLLLAAVAAFLTLKLSFYSGNIILEGQPKKFEALTGQTHLLLLILTVTVGLLSAVTVFLYKDRKLQLKLTFLTLVLSLLNLFLFYNHTTKFVPGEGKFAITASVAVVIPVLLILAIRGIYKDQKLVKSLERLR